MFESEKKPVDKPLKFRFSLPIQYFSDPPVDPPTDPPVDPPATPPTPPADPSNAQGSELTLDAVQKFVNENQDGKKWLQSFADGRVTEALKTYETKTLPKKLEEEISKRYPAETSEQKAFRELKQQFEESERQRAHEALKTKALTVATSKGIPADIVDFLIGTDETVTNGNIDKIAEAFNTYAQKVVDQKFKDNGGTPPPSGGLGKVSEQKLNKAREKARSGRPEDMAAYIAMKRDLENKS
jgi:hypothetical protein